MPPREQHFLSAAQIRAARALLDWSQDDLAHHSGLSVNTIRKLELGHISPRDTTSGSIRKAFEDNGLEFMHPNGVRQRPDDIRIYHGQDGACSFYDDVYEAARQGNDIVMTCPNAEKYFSQILGDYSVVHINRMVALNNKISVRCVLTEDREALPAARYCQYRWISRHYVDSVPFYVYGDKYAIIVLNADPSPKITVIQSRETADAFRKQFESMWEKGTPLNKIKLDKN